MNYLIFKNNPGKYACRLRSLQNVADDYELLRGISRLADFSPDAYFKMNENFPDCLQLEDVIDNRNDVLVISAALKDLIGKAYLKNNELLPVTIVNHKGRKCKEKYYILSQIKLQDCIDLEKTIARQSNMDPDQFISIIKLAIREENIDPEVAIFRMRKFPFLVLFRRDLAEEILNSGFSGISFLEIEDYQGK